MTPAQPATQAPPIHCIRWVIALASSIFDAAFIAMRKSANGSTTIPQCTAPATTGTPSESNTKVFANR